MSARKPDGARRRRNATPGFRQLPSQGRVGPTPAWPLSPPLTEEGAVWESLWVLPQAAEWERMDYTRTVARYVRTVCAAEMPGADSKLLAEARQLEDRLGLTPRAMQALRWETDEPEEEEEESTKPTKTKPKARTYVPPAGG